jgi:hypothetical protein
MKRQVMTLDAPGVLRPLAMLRRRHQKGQGGSTIIGM